MHLEFNNWKISSVRVIIFIKNVVIFQETYFFNYYGELKQCFSLGETRNIEKSHLVRRISLNYYLIS